MAHAGGVSSGGGRSLRGGREPCLVSENSWIAATAMTVGMTEQGWNDSPNPQSEPGPEVSSPAWMSHAAGGLHTHRWQEGGLRKAMHALVQGCHGQGSLLEAMNAASLNQSLNGVRGCNG